MDAKSLSLGSVRKLERALGKLIRAGIRSVSEEVEDQLLALAGHDDPEIRRMAVFVLGMRLRERRALDRLVGLAVGDETDTDVTRIAIRSVGAIGEEHADLRKRSLAALAAIALDGSRSAEERGVAYLSARSAAGLATALEIAQSPDSIDKLKIDLQWLQSLVASGPNGKPATV